MHLATTFWPRRVVGSATFVAALCILLAAPCIPVSHAHADPVEGTAAFDDWTVFDDLPELSCLEAMVVDGDGNMLYSRNGDSPMGMASITKVMTAVLALESGIPLDTVCTIPNAVQALDPVSSVIGYKPGEEVTFLELIKGLLVHSGNDAAVAIACTVSGSEEAFVSLMNSKAIELGLVNTHFANSHGLDADGHYSTAADLIVLGRYAMGFPLFASIVGSPSVTIDVDGQLTAFVSTDELLNVYPGMRGIKTGYTANAGRAFLGCASRGGETVYFCILGTESNEQRWADVWSLLDWTFSHYPVESLTVSAEAPMGYVDFEDRFGWVVPTEVSAEASVRLSPFELDRQVEVTVDPSDGIAGTNDQVGQLVWSEEGVPVEARSVVTGDALVEKSSFGPFYSYDF